MFTREATPGLTVMQPMSEGGRCSLWTKASILTVLVLTATWCAASTLTDGLAMARSGDYVGAMRTFNTAPGSCVGAFSTKRDRSDCVLLRTLLGAGIKAFCARGLQDAQATYDGIQHAIEIDSSNTQARVAELQVLLEAEAQFGGASVFLDASIDNPRQRALDRLTELRTDAPQDADLLEAQFNAVFLNKRASLKRFAALGPHGVAGGAKATSEFVATQFNALYGQLALALGQIDVAKLAALRQEQAAPRQPTTYLLAINVADATGQREDVARLRRQAREHYGDCDRFAQPLIERSDDR
ncbi:MAG: hypothetical protein ACPGQI_03085 [Gammaproteobacteria bacterium]